MVDEEKKHFEQFTVLTWQPNPARGRVKVWVDDGVFKLILPNEKFIELLTELLQDNQSYKTYYNLKNIENSLKEYQGFYQYRRDTDEYKALHQMAEREFLDRVALYEQTRKNLVSSDTVVSDQAIYDEILAPEMNAFKKKQGAIRSMEALNRYYGTGGVIFKR